jgi:hypothetical protein
MQELTPKVPEAAEGSPEPMEEIAEEVAVATRGKEAAVPPEATLEVGSVLQKSRTQSPSALRQ